MMRTILGLGVVLVFGFAPTACSGSGGGSDSHILTPDERLAEEEKAAYEAEQAKKKRVAEEGEPVLQEEPTAKPFDQKQAEMELTRATRSAESCTGVVTDSKERGEATVSIVFNNDGAVSKATVSPPFDGTPLGDCIVNAYKNVIVPPFDESSHAMPWELKLSDPPKDTTAKKSGKK